MRAGRFIRLQADFVYGDEKALGQKPDAAERERQDAGEGAGAGHADPHEAVDENRHGADEEQDEARGKRCRYGQEAEAGRKGKDGRQHCAAQRTQESDTECLI